MNYIKTMDSIQFVAMEAKEVKQPQPNYIDASLLQHSQNKANQHATQPNKHTQ